MSRPTGKGKVCQACSTLKVRCSFAGRSTAVDSEVIKGIVNDALGTLNKMICKQGHAIEEMSTEIFSLSVRGRPTRDEEWSEERETLKNWRLWGQLGSAYQHLPKVTPESLRSWTEAAPAGISSGELQEAGQDGPESSTIRGSSDEEPSSNEEDDGVSSKPLKSIYYPDE